MSINQILKIKHPIIMAPMFLVSNEELIIAGMRAGVMAVFPSLNYREHDELNSLLKRLNKVKEMGVSGDYGVNIIVQKTNPLAKKHLEICLKNKVPFFITSLGNPRDIIFKAHEYGGKVFCDVVNMEQAEKCFQLNCDGFIAVGQGAGGHAGNNPLSLFIPALKRKYKHTPVVAAGGIADSFSMQHAMGIGADGVSVGTRFIASIECSVNEEYKNAIVKAGIDDIVLTTKLSGTPCNIIDNEDAKKIGYEQNVIEKFLSNNPRTKKWFKTLVQLRGMRKLKNSITPNNYNKLWSAGKSVEFIDDILSVEDIVKKLIGKD